MRIRVARSYTFGSLDIGWDNRPRIDVCVRVVREGCKREFVGGGDGGDGERLRKSCNDISIVIVASCRL